MFAAPARAADGPPLKRDYDQDAITAQIRQNTPEAVGAACAEAKRLMARAGRQGDYAVLSLRYRWVVAMMDVGRHAEALPLIAAGIDRISSQIEHVDALQKSRVQCLLALGRNEEALGHAKVYYNVCYMKSSGAAMELVVECLRAARPDQPELVQRFVEEQVAGATVTTRGPGRRTSVLESIKIPDDARRDFDRKADARRNTPATKAPDRASLGNYLLMADRPAEARKVFEETYHLTPTGTWAKDVTENVARALRAEDGAIGRANAWVLAHR